MQGFCVMKIRFVAGFSPISSSPQQSHAFYADGLGVSFDAGDADNPSTHSLPGVKHFGIWTLAEAAETCFGTSVWPAGLPVPQATIEFEVEDVSEAARELVEQGFALLHGARTEPWAQVTARLMSPEGLLVGVVSTPWLSE